MSNNEALPWLRRRWVRLAELDPRPSLLVISVKLIDWHYCVCVGGLFPVIQYDSRILRSQLDAAPAKFVNFNYAPQLCSGRPKSVQTDAFHIQPSSINYELTLVPTFWLLIVSQRAVRGFRRSDRMEKCYVRSRAKQLLSIQDSTEITNRITTATNQLLCLPIQKAPHTCARLQRN